MRSQLFFLPHSNNVKTVKFNMAGKAYNFFPLKRGSLIAELGQTLSWENKNINGTVGRKQPFFKKSKIQT